MIERIGRYRILQPLGEGGMGVVYTAHDEALDRRIAVKTLREQHADPHSRERFWREARAAARISHPNVCPIYEVGEADGQLFLAMELLEGEPLSSKLDGPPLGVAEAGNIALAMLSALEALHRAGVIHRDLKPSNVFLTPHGVKLLDFGLARHANGEGADTVLTQTGMVIGTPRYMAPEQVTGQEPDARTDLFAVGVVLYELLSGRAAFAGRTIAEVLHAVVYDHPPALVGSSAIAAVDRVIQRAISKSRTDRYPDAASMAADLRAAMVTSDTMEVAHARPLTRVIVMPLRVLRADPETDFLAVSLADAVTGSLSGLEALTVRSSLAAARFAGESLDLARLASEAQVDAVLTGTLLRAGNQVRVSVQLLEAPSGTVLWTQTTQTAFEDLFELQDRLAQQIVEALAVPLTAGEKSRVKRDVPSSPEAYELFLRANQLAIDARHWTQAIELYKRCVSLDPDYAPAWARLGRCYRVMAKYGLAEVSREMIANAEQAFRRALDLNPELSLTHTLFAAHECELGRSRDAMTRLLARAAARPTEPELLSGLCHSLRYAGLLDASRVAHEKASRLDPMVLTSGSYTYYALGQLEKALFADLLGPRFNHSLALFDLGRVSEAKMTVRPLNDTEHAATRLFSMIYNGGYDHDAGVVADATEKLLATGFMDPEGWYLAARTMVKVGHVERGLVLIEGVLDKGYVCYRWMLRDPWLDAARGAPEFSRIVRAAEKRYAESRAAYVAAGGEKLLGIGSAA
jgi:serine/threonine protein kinase/tetratricopeptide (TPR) repeat protein